MDISQVSTAMLTAPAFWVALAQIILINIMLSGDNAVVIALASRSGRSSSAASAPSSCASC
jgi:predicted tellurium resistance membrane protein TerC